MDFNSKQLTINNNHHIACLSGLSQLAASHNSGLIMSNEQAGAGGGNIATASSPKCAAETASERSTPNSLNSFSSTPNRISTPHLQQQQYSPSLPVARPPSSIFFPQLAARSNQQQQPHHHQQHQTPLVTAATSTKIVDRSPRSVDINMNAEHEKNRELLFSSSSNSAAANNNNNNNNKMHHQHHHQRFSSTASQQSGSKLNSPNIMPAKSFPGFFAEPTASLPLSSSCESHNQQEQHNQQQPAVRRSINLTTASNDDLDRWPHQQQQPDETYHLYHEPLDMEELAKEEAKQQPDTALPGQASATKGSLSTIMNSADSGNQQAASNRRVATPTGSPLRRNDVSADIYLCYVSLKANERSNQRSRSYHGQKNTNFMRPNQTLSSNSFADLPKSPISNESLTLKEHCINELIGTEMNYTHALNHILTHFAEPLEPLLRRDENQLIFGHMKYFHHVHKAFQVDLVKNAPNVSICFLNFRDKFLRYGDYCATLSRAQSLLEDLVTRNEAIAAQLDRCHDEADEGKFKLADLLSLPMQRILKYHLLLAELIRSSSSNEDPDHEDLKRAHEAMIDLGKYINEAKRDTELMQIIDDIEQSISGLNMPANTKLTDYGRLHIDGIIRVKVPAAGSPAAAPTSHHHHGHESFISSRSSDFKIKQKRYAFVFDKVLLMCKVGGVKGYQYKEALVLSEYSIDTDPIIVQSDTISAKHLIREKWNYAFNLVRNADQTTYTFYAKDSEMKNNWIGAIQKAFDNIRPAANYCNKNEPSSSNHEFLMHTFERASSCDHCGKLFHGIHYQGYRCRTCFTSAHKTCLSVIRPCGPTLPPKHSASSNTLPPKHFNSSTLPQLVIKDSLKEPISPSIRSNSSDDSHNFFNASFQPAGPNELATMAKADQQQQHSQTLQPDGRRNADNNYINSMLKHYPWFCGRMDREQAQSLLENKPDGTFLVRVSPKHNGSYVISLIYNSKVNHMRIYVSKDNQLYLSQNRYFKSVFELVSWYEKNSLVESFHMLDAHLAIPYKKLHNLII